MLVETEKCWNERIFNFLSVCNLTSMLKLTQILISKSHQTYRFLCNSTFPNFVKNLLLKGSLDEILDNAWKTTFKPHLSKPKPYIWSSPRQMISLYVLSLYFAFNFAACFVNRNLCWSDIRVRITIKISNPIFLVSPSIFSLKQQ